MNLLAFTPMAVRHESPHGQGTVTYGEYNARPQEMVYPQDAPDPVRYGDTPARPSRRPIVITQTDPNIYGYGMSDIFRPMSHILTRRIQPAGRHLDIRAQQTFAVRPNIDRGTVSAYGSLFSLSPGVYDYSRG